MSPKLERKRPDPDSHLVRRAEPIRTGGSGTGEPPAPPDAGPAPDVKRRAPRRRPERSAPDSGTERSNPERSADGRPTARDLAAPARRSVAREALKADVPADLGLIQRLHRYRLDKGVDIRDQVAIAVDEWLTAEGY